MKILGTLIMVFVILAGIAAVVCYAVDNNDYTNQVGNFWTLADRASTIEQKSDYMDQYYTALQNAGLQGMSSALLFKNSENGFDTNLAALKSLTDRLHAIKTMDENSYQYQAAIQQITAQEQGQASDMLGVFSSCWWEKNHYFFWNGIMMMGFILLEGLAGATGIFLLVTDFS